MEIRLPSQSLFLAGESPEVDNLVKRARPIDGADSRSRSLVPQPTSSPTAAPRTVAVAETHVDYESLAARFQGQTRTPTDLYRQISNVDLAGSKARFVDVFA